MNLLTAPAHDPLHGFFHWGNRYFETTNSHLHLIGGHLDANRLGQALQETVQEFELLRDVHCNYRGSKLEAALVASTYPGEVSFSNPDLRRSLMEHASIHPASHAHPVRLQLIRAADRQSCCLHLLISHEVADVKSGALFMQRLMSNYTEKRTAQAQHPSRHHFPSRSLKASRPGWFSGSTIAIRRARAYLDIAQRMLSPHRSLLRGTPSDSEGKDFFHCVLPDDLQDQLRQSARRHETTLNTLFSAALVRLMEKRNRHPGRKITYSFAVSLRKSLGTEHQQAFRSYMLPCTLKLAPPQCNDTLLKELSEKTQYLRSDGLQQELGRMENAVGLYTSRLPTPVVRWVMKRTQGTNIFFSNPGVIEEDFSHFSTPAHPVYSSLILGCLVSPYDLMFYTSTFNGRTQFDIVFRPKCFGDIEGDFVKPFLAELKVILECVPSQDISSASRQ